MNFVWTPPTNVTGNVVAFKVSVEDSAGLRSSTIATVNVTISGANQIPAFVSTTAGFTGVRKQSQRITYDDLMTKLTLDDPDSNAEQFVVTAITAGGKLYKGNSQIVTLPVPPVAPVAADNNTLSRGEEFLYSPDDAMLGSTTVFEVRGWDGISYTSNTAIVSVNYSPVYAFPVLTSATDFIGVSQNQAYTFTYQSLRDLTNAASADESIANPLSFKIKTIHGGSLSKTGSLVSTGMPFAMTDDTTLSTALIYKGDSFSWTPPAGANGRIRGFTIVATQSFPAYLGSTPANKDSLSSVDVNFQVARANTLPVFKNAGTPVNGGAEDMPQVISYNQLVANYEGEDAETGVLKYQITELSNASASYSRQYFDGSGNRVVAALTNALLPVDIGPGESIIYRPVLNDAAAVQNIVRVKLKDGDGSLSAADRVVQLLVTSVNDAPTYGAISALPSTTKNIATGFAISYATLKAAVNVVDPDTAASSIEFRIESVNSGSLRGGATNAGSVLSVNTNDTATMPFVVSASPSGNRYTDVNWTPPQNGEGNFSVFTVRAYDGMDYAATTVKVQISVTPSNTPPTLNAGFTLGTSGTAGTVQNGAVLVSYDTLLTRTAAADADDNVITFQVTYLESGVLTSGGTTVNTTGALGTPLTIPVGGTLIWRPASNAVGTGASALSAFRVKAYDGGLSSSTESLFKVNVTAENQVPAVANNPVYPVIRNTVLEKSLSDLGSNIGVTDLESVIPTDAVGVRYNSMKLRVTGVLNGSLRIGLSTDTWASASPWVISSNDALDSTKSKLFWMPPTDVSETTVDAFTVVAVDAGNLVSPTYAKVQAAVSGSNLAPNIASITKDYTGATQNNQFKLLFNTLKNDLSVTDADSSNVTLVFTNISNGSLLKGGTALQAVSWTPTTLPNPDNQIQTYEELVYLPSYNLTGQYTVFKVRAWDGVQYSANEATVRVTIAAVNQAPMLTRVRDFTGGVKNAATTFSYDDLRGNPAITDGTQRSDASDAEEALPTKTLKFKVKALTSGTLERTSPVTNPGTPEAVPLNGFISAGDQLSWTPSANAIGRLNGFSVVAYDGTTESAQAIPVYFNYVDSNQPPVFQTSTFLSGAREDIPYVITYSMLASAYPGLDDNTSVLGYKVDNLSGAVGSLSKNGLAVTSGSLATTPVIVNPGDYLIWSPPANANSGVSATRFKLFTLKLVDADTVSSIASKDVEATLASVNDAPTYGTVALLSQTVKNVSGGRPISYANVAAAVPVTDIDADTISYRIESIGSGRLVLGSSNTGIEVNTGVSMPRLVASGADGINTASDLNWTPPLNGEGNFLVMTVRAYDGFEYASTTQEVRINVQSGNFNPTVTNLNVTLGVALGTSGTTQNGALPVSYNTLLNTSGALDPDGNMVSFKIMSLQSGSVIVAGTTYTSGNLPTTAGSELAVGPGESFVWRPAPNERGTDASALSAFTVKAFDGVNFSSVPTAYKVNVSAVNQAPSLTVVDKTYTGAVRNNYYMKSFADLAADLGVADAENVNPSSPNYSLMKLRIEHGGARTEIRVGTSANVADAVLLSDANRLILNGTNVFWLPPTNRNGVFDAYIVAAVDANGDSSPMTANVKIDVSSGSNAAPQIAGNTAAEYNLGSSPQGRPIALSYEQLRSSLNVTDADNTYKTLVLASAPNATLVKGSTTLTVTSITGSTAPITSPLPANSSVIAPNENIVVYPVASVVGNGTVLFTVRAWDGEGYSTTAGTVKVDLTAFNQLPTLTRVGEFNGVIKNTAFNFTYDTLRGDPANTTVLQRTDAFDAEENIASKSLKFKITRLESGSLVRTGGTTGAIAINSLINPGDSFSWTPPSNVLGSVDGFGIVALDAAGGESSPDKTVKFIVSAPNVKPSFASSSFLTGAYEDVPFNISYSMLSSNYAGSDDTTSVLKYRLTSLTGANGTLSRNGLPITVGSLPLTLLPNDSLTWTPEANTNSGAAGSTPLYQPFTMVLVDNEGLESDPVDVKISVTAVNDIPTSSGNTALSAIAKNASVSITHTMLFAALPFADNDFAPSSPTAADISYRIESVRSGTLRKVSGDLALNIVAGDTSSMPLIVSSGANGSTRLTSVYWTPALNAEGTQIVMTVRAFDGTDYAATTQNVTITVNPLNSAPVIANTALILGASGTGTSGTTQNGQLPVSYDTLLVKSGATDSDENAIWFKLTAIGSGKIKLNGTEYTTLPGSPLYVKPGEMLVWSPAANVAETDTTGLAAFTVQAYDGMATSNLSTNSMTVRARVSATNQAPTLNANWTYNPGADFRNKPVKITFDDLVSNLNVADLEDVGTSGANRFDTMRMRIELQVNGQGLFIGTGATVSSAVAVDSSNNTLGVGTNLFWLPPEGYTGTTAAFKVSAVDTQNTSSEIVATVSVNVQGSNAIPTMSAASKILDLGTSSQGAPLVVTYAAVKTAFGLDDLDSPLTSLVITGITNSTLKKGNTTLTATTVAAGSVTAPPTTSVIAPGETVVIYPSATATGLTTFFTARAWDGAAYSDATTGTGSVRATLTAVNQAPGLTYVKDFTSVIKNTEFAFTYNDFRGNPSGTPGVERTNAFDAEEALPATTLKFKVKSLGSGTLYKVVSSTATLLTVGENIDSQLASTTWKWNPPTDAVGRIIAFTVVAFDGVNESSALVPVYFQVSAPNQNPAFVSATNADITGAYEDVPFNISYAMLENRYRGTDDQAGPVRYQITETVAANGKLYLNGVELVNGISLPVNVGLGQILTWVPTLYTNSPTGLGISAFKIKLIDDDGLLSTGTNAEQTVKVVVAPVNNIPTFHSNSALSPALSKNSGRAITYADIFAAIKFKDNDYYSNTSDPAAGQISYRIESVNSGELRKTNGGTLINPVSTSAASMPLLVNSGGNGTDRLESVYWTPANNATGSQMIMTLRGFDGADYSATATTVTITVNSSNSKPVIATTSHTMGQGGTSGTSQNGQLPITYSTLLQKSGATDVDGDVIWFKVTAIASGSLKVNGNDHSVLPGSALYIKPNESVVWSPAANQNGTDATALSAFTVTAYDQLLESDGALAVKVNVSAVNQAPTLAASWINSSAGATNSRL
ncbi:MAG: hypothetical protein EBR09_13885 [Proteobacteria bacterium]|nr:hypothetical protein [Pseudomonadota bacterium]